jgi:nucleoside-diphosphate-sugar epimerase
LVTGGTGFVGYHTAVALLDAGHRVRLLVRNPAKLERVYTGRAAPDYLAGDVRDEAAVRAALEGSEAVVHAAAVVALEAHRAHEVLETNARAVELVVGGAHRMGIGRILYVSSIGALFRPGGGPVDLDSPVAPGKNAYARSKADAERFVRGLQERGAPIVISYPAGVIGPDDPGLSETNHGLRTMVRDLFMFTSGGFQAVDVRDLAAIHRGLLERDKGPGRYITGGHFMTWRELGSLLESITERSLRRITLPGALLRAGGHVGDVIKRLVDFDFPITSESMRFATLWQGADSSATLDELGLAFRDPRETFSDALRWMHRAGHVDSRFVGRLAD